MFAITTKWAGPTNSRGSRIIATADWGDHKHRLTVAWNYAHNVDRNHQLAAMALARKLGWHGQWVGGELEHGFAFVRTFAGEFAFEVEKPADPSA